MSKETPELTGSWTMSMDLGDATIHQYVRVHDDLKFTFFNSTEEIQTSAASIKNDSIYLEMPVYHTHFVLVKQNNDLITGYWNNPDRGADYKILCSFQRISDESISQRSFDGDTLTYEIMFSADTEDEYPAIGHLSESGNYLSGTFETEYGDYRFLEGSRSGDSLNLQCFDGSHAFHFSIHQPTDSLLTGVFRSGTHWEEPLQGKLNSDASLRNPLTITSLVDDTPLDFVAMDNQGELVRFNSDQFDGKVTIIQILGSWCPNCLDESLYYKSLYEDIQNPDFQIIPVAFERSSDFTTNTIHLDAYKEELALPYDLYLGGKASKSVASELFPQLSSVSSFPTSIYLDREGNVRRIHTGFYGPGTGKKFERYQIETKAFISSLLEETI